MRNLFLTTFLALMVAGCTSYYRVSDNESGRTYLTTSDTFRKEGSNRVATFRDTVTSNNVTLNSYEYRQMTKEEYDADLAARQSRLPVSPK
jgi:hypothetical protein